MCVKVRRLGCSVIITLPKRLLNETDIKAGDYLDLRATVFPQGRVFTADKEKKRWEAESEKR